MGHLERLGIRDLCDYTVGIQANLEVRLDEYKI